MNIPTLPSSRDVLSDDPWMKIERATGQWFVVHTKSRQEKAFSQTLNAMSIAHFLPLIIRTSYHGRRKFNAQVPLFPSYVFLRGELDDAYLADRTKRIASVIPVVDQEQISNELRNLYLALTRKAPLDPFPYLKKGIRVEVRSGPFEGIQGIIEDRSKNDRLILQIETLGRATSLEIDGSLLEPLE